MKTALIGHRQLFVSINKRLTNAIVAEIKNGCKIFTMGTHGEFDRLALGICRELRNTYKDLEIEVVITSLNSIIKEKEYPVAPYSDVRTVMYDIEEEHYKRQITMSNRQMLDTCDTLICYVDNSAYMSGAKTALSYAQKHGLRIVNLFGEKE